MSLEKNSVPALAETPAGAAIELSMPDGEADSYVGDGAGGDNVRGVEDAVRDFVHSYDADLRGGRPMIVVSVPKPKRALASRRRVDQAAGK